MRVLLIDPWGVNNTQEYLNGLIYGLSEVTELVVFTNCHFEQYVKANCKINKVFFEKSENMKDSYLRKVMRGIEYISGYRKIISYLKKSDSFDIIHINWLLFYKLDIKFLAVLKKYCKKLVYTAHNVCPHNNGEKSIAQLEKVYDLVDSIIVHGNNVKDELIDLFPFTRDKVHVQRHGCILREEEKSVLNDSQKEIVNKCKNYSRVLIFFGLIFYNKGIDIVLKNWLQRYSNEDTLLIIAGKTTAQYQEFEYLKNDAQKCDNVMILNYYVENELLNELIRQSDVILLPYRHASMSGVIFTAAQMAKTVLCTDTGALKEYLEPNNDSFLCENTEDGILSGIDCILKCDKETLATMGRTLKVNIQEKCDWKNICMDLVNHVYERG